MGLGARSRFPSVVALAASLPGVGLLGVGLLGVGLLGAGRAHAYQRTTVDRDPTTPLSWPQRELGLWVAEDTATDVASVDARDAIVRSLTTWSRAGGCTDIAIGNLGVPPDTRTNLLGGEHDGENRIVFRDEGWPPELGPDTLAITSLVYRRSTGEILDADIDLNALDHTWSVAASPPEGATDVENTVTHELGHFLGFAHVEDPAATMFAESGPGDVDKRSLSEDDLAAVCETYPASLRTPGGNGVRPPITSQVGCSAGALSASSPRLALATLLLGVTARGRRRARRARRAR